MLGLDTETGTCQGTLVSLRYKMGMTTGGVIGGACRRLWKGILRGYPILTISAVLIWSSSRNSDKSGPRSGNSALKRALYLLLNTLTFGLL